MNFKKYIEELKRRNVVKASIAYLVVAWLITQVFSIIIPAFELPPSLLKNGITVFIIGFPIWLIFSWIYELTPDGIKKTEDIQPNKSILIQTSNKLNKIIIGALGITIVLLLVNLFVLNKNKGEVSLDDNNKIAVLKFGNNTGNNELDVLGKMAEDWIMHGITENSAGQTISQDLLEDYKGVLNSQSLNATANDILNDYFKPSKKVSGSYFLNGDQLIFQCSVKNGFNDETLIALEKVNCDSKNPLDCIEILKQKIVSFLVIEQSGNESFETKPPNFEAYKAMLEAKASNRANEIEKYLELINKAIALDSTFFEPKALKVGYYYNYGNYSKADSLIHSIKQITTGISERQQSLLNMYKAAIDGENDKVYRYQAYEYNIAPFDLDTNLSLMVIGLQFVNKPEDLEAIFNEISFDNFNLENCRQCLDRIYMMGMAHIELKEYSKAIQLLKPIVGIINNSYFLRIILKAYIRSNNQEMVDNLLKNVKLKINDNDWFNLHLFIGRQYFLQGNKQQALVYLETIVNADKEGLDDLLLAETYYELKDFEMAEPLFLKLFKKEPENFKIISSLSKCYYKTGRVSESEDLINALEKLRGLYQYGEIDYRLAQVYAAQNDEEKVFKHLLQSIASGNFYTTQNFKNETNFLPFIDSEKWNEVLTYWH